MPEAKTHPAAAKIPDSIEETEALLGEGDYVAGRSLTTAIYLALKLQRPLFLEGEAGVGKTEIAKVLSSALSRQLIRLQCYEGLDTAAAVYEWNYPRQMIEIRLAEASGTRTADDLGRGIYAPEFLIERPLLQALKHTAGSAPVLLIDELDRADEPFEAFLLEILSDYQITIPELGVVTAPSPPIVIITSNRTREIHDALKRRCFYHWVDYPTAEKECEILRIKAPQARKEDLFKAPGIAETIDWAQALVQLDAVTLTPELFNDSVGALLKYQDDIARMQGSEANQLLTRVQTELQRELRA